MVYHPIIKRKQGGNTMKNANNNVISFRSRKSRRFPNAAERRYYFDKAVDYALTAATGAGLATAVLFLIML